MPLHSLRRIPLLSPSRLPLLLLLPPLLAGIGPHVAKGQQTPVAVMAVSGVDRLLEDVEFVFDVAGQPQYSEMIRGVIANFNELRGLDRQRPAGVFLYFPSAGQEDPQPLLFFPVSNIDELVGSVRLGNALRLEPGDAADRLTLHTEDGALPVKVQHGYAFLDPTPSSARLRQPLDNPDHLLQGSLERRDAVLIVRREGIPPFLFEAALGQLRGEAVKAEQQKGSEPDAQFALRRDVTQSLLSLGEAVLTDWRSATVGLTLSAADRVVELDASVTFAADAGTRQFLSGITGRGTQFSSQLADVSAFSISTNWQPTPPAREFLKQLVTMLRQQVMPHLVQANEPLRAAALGVLDAFEATAGEEQFDAFIRLAGAPPNSFVLLGGVALAEADKMAAGLEQLLPFAAKSKDIRSIEMSVGRAGDVAIHRMIPMKLRKQDQRLYGNEAAIYLAAGADAFWFAIGDEGALDQLTDAIQVRQPAPRAVLARPDFPSRSTDVPAAGPALFTLTMHASDWVGFARTDGGGKNARLAEIARAAFADPDEDGFHLSLVPMPEGLRLRVTLDHGYIRLFGLALAARLQPD